jgi:lactate dehydrogenase-like 2-hydroxyacid dehydrogenase
MILIPDAVFEDDHAIERTEVAPLELLVRRANKAGDVVDDEWAAADAVIAYHRMTYDAALCAKLARCRIVVRAGVGYDNIDLASFAARGIPVCNVPDYGIGEVADHTMALLLALVRGVVEFHRAIAADPVRGWDWQRWPRPVRRLKGQRLLIVGFGRVGAAVARRAAALELAISCYDPLRKDTEGFHRAYDLDAALASADIVSLHAALPAGTGALIDRRRLAVMPPGAILINTARGGLVDLDALGDALRTDHIAAAALDVLPEEPPDHTHPLIAALAADEAWLRGRLIVTPHTAFLSRNAIAEMRRKAAATVAGYFRDGTLVNRVNR